MQVLHVTFMPTYVSLSIVYVIVASCFTFYGSTSSGVLLKICNEVDLQLILNKNVSLIIMYICLFI